jgi:hypothetical protein
MVTAVCCNIAHGAKPSTANITLTVVFANVNISKGSLQKCYWLLMVALLGSTTTVMITTIGCPIAQVAKPSTVTLILANACIQKVSLQKCH